MGKNQRFYPLSPNPKSLTCTEAPPVPWSLCRGQLSEQRNLSTVGYLQRGSRSNLSYRNVLRQNERRLGQQGRLILRLRNSLRLWPNTSPTTPSGRWTEPSRRCPQRRDSRS